MVIAALGAMLWKWKPTHLLLPSLNLVVKLLPSPNLVVNQMQMHVLIPMSLFHQFSDRGKYFVL